jgi:hypothetical protein
MHQQFLPDVDLEGAITRPYTLSRAHQGPRAVLNALERLREKGKGPQLFVLVWGTRGRLPAACRLFSTIFQLCSSSGE